MIILLVRVPLNGVNFLIRADDVRQLASREDRQYVFSTELLGKRILQHK